MRIEVKIDPSCSETEIVVRAASMTEEVNKLVEAVKNCQENIPQVISGVREGKHEILDQTDLIRIYANSGKVFAVTDHGEYTVRLKLYELENRLDQKRFVRISKSEIIHLKKVRNFDLSIAGTICVKLSNGMTTYVSRRYVSKIRQILGV